MRDRPIGSITQARGNLGVEPHLALVEPKCESGPPAHRISRGDFEDHRGRALLSRRVTKDDPVALAHLPGADSLDGKTADLSITDRSAQPLRREIIGPFDHRDRRAYRSASEKSTQASRRCGCGSYSTWVWRSNTSTGRSVWLYIGQSLPGTPVWANSFQRDWT